MATSTAEAASVSVDVLDDARRRLVKNKLLQLTKESPAAVASNLKDFCQASHWEKVGLPQHDAQSLTSLFTLANFSLHENEPELIEQVSP